MGFKSYFTENILLKILSIILAIILWFFVILGRKGEIGLVASLEYANIKKDYVIINDRHSEIDIRVYGPKSLLFGLSGQQLNYQIDLINSETGTYTFNINPDRIKLPRGVNITRISPPSIVVELDRIAQKKVPIKVEVVGQASKEYRLYGIEVVPPEVTISGPSTALHEIEIISTEIINITGLKENIVERDVALKPPDFQNIDISLQEVKVTIKILKEGPIH